MSKNDNNSGQRDHITRATVANGIAIGNKVMGLLVGKSLSANRNIDLENQLAVRIANGVDAKTEGAA